MYYKKNISMKNKIISKFVLSILGFIYIPCLSQNVVDLDSNIEITQTINQKGAVVITGNFTKPVTSDQVVITIKYKNSSGNWVSAWDKTFAATNEFNQNLTASFELPASNINKQNVKIELSSNTNLSNWQSIIWQKTVYHYKQSDYTTGQCQLNENDYTYLFTPKTNETVVLNQDGTVKSIKDRVTSLHLHKKLDNIALSINATGTLNTSNPKAPVINIENPNNLTILANTQKYIYQGSELSPFEYSYHDPVYMFAGKFSDAGFFVNFSNWALPLEEGGEQAGRGYLDFTNPNALINRYYNLYNYINQKLTDIITNQEPVVIVISKSTGLRIYKSNSSYITINAISNYNTVNHYGYPRLYEKDRGPGSENFFLSNTSKASIYGIGAIRNRKVTAGWNGTSYPLTEIEKEIKKFINYVGIFGDLNNSDETSCITINPGAKSDLVDWKKAPNSYIFTGKDKNGISVNGFYIPVKKAYEMWKNGNYMKGIDIPTGEITADVLWEDTMGLIRSKENYKLDIIGSGEEAEIKVPVNNVKKGNAVIAYKVNGEIYWSWHVWVTNDPTNGSTYKSFDDVKRELSDGTIETIPDSEWGWMDRNLGALGNSFTGEGWNRNGGLMYQWGRKDPFPPLTTIDANYYQVSGSLGKFVYDEGLAVIKFPNSPFNDYKSLTNSTKFIYKTVANITDNIRLSVKNPLSLIYVTDDGTVSPSVYGTYYSVPYYYNWFGIVPGLQTHELSKVNLWSDNSFGVQATDITVPQPYRNKSSYDPCPNGWRLPSVLVASATKNVRMDFTPFGPKSSNSLSNLNTSKSNISPGLSNLKPYLAGIKIYPQYGFDMTNVAGNNMGIFPGTGWIGRGASGDGRYHTKASHTDHLETYLWTSTMTTFGEISSVASALRLIPSSDQIVNKYQPDSLNYPNVYGLYRYKPADDYPTNNAHACRCIKDPLFEKNNYNFETRFFSENETYTAGLDNPNAYMITKSPTDQLISIPVSKAFSVQSNYLGNTQILNPVSFNNLKANVLWADNNELITQLTVDNPASKEANINVKINANKSGNALITLHNGSIDNPVYWSWHIWVTNSEVSSLTYVNDEPITTDNYVNYTQYGTIMKTKIMDRNLGAIDVMPTVYNQFQSGSNALLQLNNSQGLHYQWGRKDPLPTFTKIAPSNSKFNVYLGRNNNGTVTYSTLTENMYNSSQIVNYNTYKNNINSSDKIDVRIEKILGYSVANPLKFMMPNVVYPTRPNNNYMLGSDWLLDTGYHGLYPERWGLGGNKSVFDPCPNGWRIPETVTGLIKSSPWSLKNNPEYVTYSSKEGQPVGNFEKGYYGSVISHLLSPGTSIYGKTVGFVFNNSEYNTGNYPKGYIRGKRSVLYKDGLSSIINPALGSGIWYANLHEIFTGRGTYMHFDHFSRILVKYTNVDPYAAMNCRCIKQEDNGVSRGPLPGIPVSRNATYEAKAYFTQEAVQEDIKNEKLVLYPNPVKDILNIEVNDSKDYYYQIYNLSGQLVKEGKFQNKQTDISSLKTGYYLIRVNNSEIMVKILKQ